MNHQQIETVVLSVLTAVLRCDVDCGANRNNTPQWDSLKNIEIIFAVEDELGLRFPEEVLETLNSVTRLVDSAEELLSAT